MNKILFLCGAITLLTTAGCVVAPDDRRDPYRGQARYERQEVIVPDPVVVVRPPEIIVR